MTGLGKGFGGFVLKDLAAIIGPFGYTLKGVHKEMTKNKQPAAFIRRSRMIQAGKDIAALDEDERRECQQKVDTAWRVLQQIKNEEDMVRSKGGVMGSIRAKRTKKKLESQGAFESVERAKKIVEDRKMSRFIEENKKPNAENEKKAAEQYKQGEKTPKKNKLVKIQGGDKSGDDGNSDRSQQPHENAQPDQAADDEASPGFFDSDETAVQTPEATTELHPNEHNKTLERGMKGNIVP